MEERAAQQATSSMYRCHRMAPDHSACLYRFVRMLLLYKSFSVPPRIPLFLCSRKLTSISTSESVSASTNQTYHCKYHTFHPPHSTYFPLYLVNQPQTHPRGRSAWPSSSATAKKAPQNPSGAAGNVLPHPLFTYPTL